MRDAAATGHDAGPVPGPADGHAHDEARAGRDREDVERIAFFSDAVFAIALTLLAIDLRLPDMAASLTSSELTDALVALWPKIYSFTLSFVVVFFYWYGHYRMFRAIRRPDAGLVALDAALLFFVVIIPFPTSVMGAYPELAPAVILYGAVIGAAGIAALLIWVYAARRGLLSERVTPEIVRTVTIRSAVVPAIILLSTPITLLAPVLTQVIWVCIVPLQEVVARAVQGRAR
jgi:uncharacterized membrane protein